MENMDSRKLTPTMAQYAKIKKEHEDCLLFFRLGDFYELFFDDAKIASSELNIVLTSRGRGPSDADIPMCGIPYHASENYLAKLIKSGHKVAICEQMERPEDKKDKGPIRREVIRIVTPGTIIESGLLDSKSYNYLMAICHCQNDSSVCGIAFVDISAGEFFTETYERTKVSSLIARIQPKEIIASDSIFKSGVISDYNKIVTQFPDSRFALDSGRERLKNFFDIKTLAGIGNFSDAEIAASGALIDYILLTQKKKLFNISIPRRFSQKNFLEIDGFTQKNLELCKTFSGDKEGSLLYAIDRTVTPMGARLLHMRMMHPIKDIKKINERLSSIKFFIENSHIREGVREILRGMPDIERAFSRLLLGRGGPRDLGAIRVAFLLMPSLLSLISSVRQRTFEIESILKSIAPDCKEMIARINSALNDELPMSIREGGIIARGYNTRLDELYKLSQHGEEMIFALQGKYAKEAEIPSLKIKKNNIIGYYIEISQAFTSKMPFGFTLRQSTASFARYTTEELLSLEQRFNQSYFEALQLESDLFDAMVTELREFMVPLKDAIKGIATLDVTVALSNLADEMNYCMPEMDDSKEFDIKGGRHPVIDQILKNDFVKNPCDLSDNKRMWLLTGPNMAGKSTFLRQNALIAIMAHMGSFVPADYAHIGTIDRIFSRIGASDDISRGYSTFMVEMIETSSIINQATERSFVILDEVGRGTSTYDGIAIAWACAEHMATAIRCRTLFATHYHELKALEERVAGIACYTFSVKETEQNLIFLYNVVSGCADSSYGLCAARFAGIPTHIINNAQEILRTLEKGSRSIGAAAA